MKTCKQLAMDVAEKIERKKRKQKRRRTIAALCLAAMLLPCAVAAVCTDGALNEPLKKVFTRQEEPIEPEGVRSTRSE